jgi:glycerophosphoryl diester phosphodiesterase
MLKVGHRGAAGHAPENTLRGIETAIALKADLAEVDLRRTKDGHLVLLHDRTVNRTTNGSGAIAALLLRDARRFDAGQGQRIPTLDEILRAATERIGLILEIKVEGLAEEVLRTVRQVGFKGPLLVASFFHTEIRRIRDLDAKTRTLALFQGVPVNPLALVTAARATDIGLPLDHLTQSLAARFRAAGTGLFTYTVNDPADIQQARAVLVDGIISDYPDRL